MLIYVPEGKVLKARAGGYVFRGPTVINPRDKFRLEATYTDGSPLEYIDDANSAKLPDPPAESPAPASDHSEVGSGRKRKNPKRVRGDNPVPQSDGESFGTEILFRELGDSSDAGARCGESPEVYPRIFEHPDETPSE